MGLSQSIVVVNQFSVKGTDGTGSRGSTPGLYVERYIIDDDKNEALWPIDGYTPDMSLASYDREFSEIAHMRRLSDVEARIGRKRDGVAFSADSVSMSFEQAHELAVRIQDAFDAGKTVFKTVVTFEDSYLDRMGVAEPGYSTGRRGAHKGHVDQLKLRHALQEGMSRMSRGFDDLVWIASAHLDKAHVHFHIAAVDVGEGRLRHDGMQRGMLSRRDIRRLRQGIDDDLVASYPLKSYFGTSMTEALREANTVRSYVHAAVERRGVPQLIIAALPDDVSLWRADSRDPRMRRALGLTSDYVRSVLAEPTSGFGDAITEVQAYAERYGQDLSSDDRVRLVHRASNVVERGCVQAVFDTLSVLPKDLLTIESSFIDMMAAEGTTLANASSEDAMADFSYKLRTYSRRLAHHKEERRRYHEEEERYLAVKDPAPEASAAYDFFAFERLYQERLMAKYQYLMGFLPQSGTWSERMLALLESRVELVRMEHAVSDVELWHLPPERAEVFGFERYGFRGASALSGNPHGLDDDLAQKRAAFDVAESDFAFDAAEDGLQLVWSGEGSKLRLELEHAPLHSFEDVRALDLHRVVDDFSGVLSIDYGSARVFVESAVDRKHALDDAIDYFRRSGQSALVSDLPVRDVDEMYDMAMALAGTKDGSSDVAGNVSGSGHVPHVKTLQISESVEDALRDALLREVSENRGLELVVHQLEM